MLESLIDELARRRGVGEAYHDYRGELRRFNARTKTAILSAMGCDVGDAAGIAREIAILDEERWRIRAPAVTVVRPGHSGTHVVVPVDALEQAIEWRVIMADGRRIEGRARASELPELERQAFDGRQLSRRWLPLPESLPLGQHVLQLDGTVVGGEGSLLVAPARCHELQSLASGGRLWGVAVQLYTLRSPANWGMGDFADLRTVIRLCAEHGAAFIGLNPLHALFPSNPGHYSPYSPSSRHFLNVLYVAVPEVPGYLECAGAHVGSAEFQQELARLRATDYVDYQGVARAKLPVLAMLYEHFRRKELDRDTELAREFLAYLAERGEPLRRHALHDAIDAYLRLQDPDRYWGWPAWPPALRDPAGAGVAGFEDEQRSAVEYYAWLQWIADQQLGEAQRLALELGMPIGLYGDFAVGVNPCGAETWSDQQVYRMRAGVGAPPDPLALKGQDWGIPPQDPHALVAAGYRPFRDLIAANMRHFGALRLDHVMALFRQWWVPVGLGATEGGYVHYPVDDLMSVLALESERHRCLVVGEDLGTVPDEVRRAMAEFAVYSYKVLLFEKHGDGSFRRPAEYVRRAIATVTTHDLPTLRGWWEGRDLELRDRLHLFPGDEIRRYVHDERSSDRAQMVVALESEGFRKPPDGALEGSFDESLAHDIQLYLARSAAGLVVLQFEDLIGMTDPVNVPGTSHEHANWQRKVTADIEEALGRESTRRLFADVRKARAS